MSVKDEDTYGLDAFRAALKRQGGAMHRAATFIDPGKGDFGGVKERHRSDNERIADAVQQHTARGPDGKFQKKAGSDG